RSRLLPCTAGGSASASCRRPRESSRSIRARCTPRCSGSRRTASSRATGTPRTTTAEHGIIASPRPDGARWASSSRAGSGSPPASNPSSAPPEKPMSWIHGARARLHLLFAPRAAERRMDEEISFHVEMETARLMREEHFTPDEARRRALITFGGTTLHKEELREGRGLAWLGGLSLDFRLAVRMLLKHPGLTLVAVVGMAVAVAFGAVTFSAVYTVIDGTLPLDQGDRLISIRSMDTRS